MQGSTKVDPFTHLSELFSALALKEMNIRLDRFLKFLRESEEDPDYPLEFDHIVASARRANRLFQDAVNLLWDEKAVFPAADPGLHSNFGIRFEWELKNGLVRLVIPGATQQPYLYCVAAHGEDAIIRPVDGSILASLIRTIMGRG